VSFANQKWCGRRVDVVAVAGNACWQEKMQGDDEITRLAMLKAIAQGSTDERSNSARGEAQKR
jgi:hypothetical protein